MVATGLREITYTDADGRLWARQIPAGAPDSEAEFGIPLGPPSLEGLDLPKQVEVALHNQLFHRRLLSARDIRRNRNDAAAAVMAACRLDVDRLLALIEKE